MSSFVLKGDGGRMIKLFEVVGILATLWISIGVGMAIYIFYKCEFPSW